MELVARWRLQTNILGNSMSDLDIQVILSNRFRTSLEADKVTIEMWQSLGLETKAQFARLAIGRSLAMGKLEEDSLDSKGIEVPAQALFTTENIGAWIGLLVAHSIETNSAVITNQEGLRGAIRSHWHRGALELHRDWREAENNYDKFLEILISRRSEMPESASFNIDPNSDANVPEDESNNKIEDESELLVKGLTQLNIKIQIKESIIGPRMTRYRVLLKNLNDSSKLNRNLGELALAMNLGNNLPAVSNGDEAMTVFIDVPRKKSTWQPVPFERLTTFIKQMKHDSTKLNVFLGVSVTGKDISIELTSAPHLLVGGTTGSGKSVCLHSMIVSLLLKHDKETLLIALLDPKRVEFSPYSKLKNLYKGKIATEIGESKEFLNDLVNEMESRYSLLDKLGVSNISDARSKGHQLPFIAVFIEELADLVLQDKSIESLVERLAQKSRAAGIHLVLATQRPDSDTFSGLVRSNIPARIALTVQKGTESKIILDEVGAEHLLGAGDMLIKMPGELPVRAHGVFVTNNNVKNMVASL